MKPSTPAVRILNTGESGVAQDPALMERVARHKDRAAFSELYDRHAPVVFSIARSLLKNGEDARDVLQDVFAHIWQNAGQYDASRGGVRAWLCWLARVRAVDRLRSHARRLAHEMPPDASADKRHDSTEALAGSDPTPLEQAAAKEARARVSDALHALSAEQRHVVDLAYYHGLSQSEIAARTNTPLGTIKTRMRLALLKLHDLLSIYIKETP